MLSVLFVIGTLRIFEESPLVYLHLGPVVQRVSLTNLLRVISLTVLVDSIYNILKYFAEEMWVAFAVYSDIFAEKMWVAFAVHISSAKNFSIFVYHSM